MAEAPPWLSMAAALVFMPDRMPLAVRRALCDSATSRFASASSSASAHAGARGQCGKCPAHCRKPNGNLPQLSACALRVPSRSALGPRPASKHRLTGAVRALRRNIQPARELFHALGGSAATRRAKHKTRRQAPWQRAASARASRAATTAQWGEAARNAHRESAAQGRSPPGGAATCRASAPLPGEQAGPAAGRLSAAAEQRGARRAGARQLRPGRSTHSVVSS